MSDNLKQDVRNASERAGKAVQSSYNVSNTGKPFGNPNISQYSYNKGKNFGMPRVITESGDVSDNN